MERLGFKIRNVGTVERVRDYSVRNVKRIVKYRICGIRRRWKIVIYIREIPSGGNSIATKNATASELELLFSFRKIEFQKVSGARFFITRL